MTQQHELQQSTWRVTVSIAIGALIASAIVCVVWVLVGDQNGIVGRAFLTILLLAAFAGAAVFDAGQAPRRPQWYVMLSMIAWVAILLAGAMKIWSPVGWMWASPYWRFVEFVGILLIIRLAILHVRLLLKAQESYRSGLTRVIASVTTGLVAVLAVMLVLPLLIDVRFGFPDFYWRVVVAFAILAAVGTALVPLIKALNTPRRPPTAVHGVGNPPGAPLQTWPTYAGTHTPLPVLPDGSPDWNAYRTGYPTHPQVAPPPPLPPQPTPR